MNLLAKAFPSLNVKEIVDVYVQKNFRALQDYFASQNQLLNFKFVEVIFTQSVANQKVSHGCGFLPQDIIVSRVTGTGTVSFNWANFTSTTLDLTATGPCRIRFYVGTYWNQQTASSNAATDVEQVAAAVPTIGVTTVINNAVTAITNIALNLASGSIAGGLAGQIPYQTSPNNTGFVPNGTAVGQVMTYQGAGVAPSWTTLSASSSASNTYNFLVNGAFDYWQAGTSTTLTSTGGGVPTAVLTYQADQWYAENLLGGGTVEGILTYAQVAGTLGGSIYGASVKITTAPTGTGIAQGAMLAQTLSNKGSQALYNQTASFGIQIKGLGNVTQVGLQFYYNGGETKISYNGNSIGSEVLCAVSSSGFTNCTINGQALGTGMTSSGVIGVLIRVAGVSTGNIYDLNNGFVAEQAIINLGSTAATFQRQNNNPAQEVDACQYFYENSYGILSTPGAATTNGAAASPCYGVDAGGDNVFYNVRYRPKRVAPTFSYWDVAGHASKVTTYVGAGTPTSNVTAIAATNISTTGTTVQLVVPNLATAFAFQWAADARM